MWPRAKLKFVARLGYGDALPIDEPLDGSFRVFGSNGPFASSSRANTRAPAIIIGRKGSYGKVNWTAEPCFASDTTFFVDESTSRNHLRWLYWLLQTLRLDEGTDEAAIPGLNRETAYARDVLVPPLSQQRAIADYLDRETMRLDDLVAEKERLIELLQEKRTAVISDAITKGLAPDVPLKNSGVEWLGEIPAHWEVKRLKRLAFMQAGTAITGDDIGAEGDYPVFGGNGVRGYSSSFTHEGEFPLVGRQGALCGCVNFATGKFWASEHAVVLRPNVGVNPTWLAQLLQVMSLNQYSQSAAQPGLSVETIGSIAAPAPLKTEQRAIASFLDCETAKIDALVAKVREAIDHLKERRAALIAAAVTGRLDIGTIA